MKDNKKEIIIGIIIVMLFVVKVFTRIYVKQRNRRQTQEIIQNFSEINDFYNMNHKYDNLINEFTKDMTPEEKKEFEIKARVMIDSIESGRQSE